MGDIAKIALVTGVFFGTLFGVVAQKDTTIVNSNANTLTTIRYEGDTIIEKEKYALMGDRYNLIWKRTSKLNASGKVIRENESAWEYKEQKLEKYYGSPNNLISVTKNEKFTKYIKINEHVYDEEGRLTKIVKSENHQIGSEEGLKKSAEYFMYLGDDGQVIKLEDNDNNKEYSGGDRMSLYVPAIDEWMELLAPK